MIINGYNPAQVNIKPDQGTVTPVRPSANVTDQGTGSSNLSNLSGGDQISGQIVAKSGNEVTISLGGDNVITARLDVAAELPVGSSVTFTVMSNDSSGVTLSPLMTNTNASSSLNTALMSAGLSIDERNLSIVSSMMERGLPIGKDNLLKMTSDLSALPTGDVSDGVMLKSLGINPTPDNISQFHAYQNYEHQISSAVNEIMDMVPQTLSDLIAEGNTSAAVDMTRDILDIFTGQGAIEQMSDSELAMSGMEMPVNMVLSEGELNELGQLLTENGIEPEFVTSMQNGEVSLRDVMFVLDDIINRQATPRGAEGGDVQIAAGQIDNASLPETEELPVIGKDNAVSVTESEKSGIAEKQSSDQPLSVSDQSQTSSSGSAGLDFLSALKSDSVNSETLSNAIHTAADINERAHSAAALKLIQSRPMAVILKTALDNQWKLTPGQVGEDKQVSDLYKRMTEQTGRLLNALNHQAKEDSPLAQSTSELAKNMNFMNELNNMFNYIQLPMKFSGNEGHGELYVYSNKKHMSSPDGSISALLHLDMDNLGPTDVYVTMNSANHVNTHFYLPDDEALDLIEAHIDELNARLEKRGYPCTTEISKREEMANMMNEILEDNKSTVPVSISNFDARA